MRQLQQTLQSASKQLGDDVLTEEFVIIDGVQSQNFSEITSSGIIVCT